MKPNQQLCQFVCGFLFLVFLFGGCRKASFEPAGKVEPGTESDKTLATERSSSPSVNKAKREVMAGLNVQPGGESKASSDSPANFGTLPAAKSPTTELKIVQPSVTLSADEQLHTYHRVEAAFISHDGSTLAKQFSMPGEKGTRYWIELSDTSNGTVMTTVECKNRIWGGAFREDGQQFVVWDIGLTFFSIDGTRLGVVRGVGSQPVELGYSVGIGYSNDSKLLFSLSKGKLYLVDAEKHEPISEFEIPTESDVDVEYLIPSRLPGSDDLLLATKQGELFRWKIGTDPVKKVGELKVTEGSPLMQAWPVFGDPNLVLSKLNWGKWKIMDIEAGKQIHSIGDGSESTAWYGLGYPTGFVDANHLIDSEAHSRDVRGPLLIKISSDGFKPIALFQLPSESVKGRDGRVLLSGDGSTLVSLLPFHEDLVYKTNDVLSDGK